MGGADYGNTKLDDGKKEAAKTPETPAPAKTETVTETGPKTAKVDPEAVRLAKQIRLMGVKILESMGDVDEATAITALTEMLRFYIYGVHPGSTKENLEKLAIEVCAEIMRPM